jgi:endonuclease YncB( thermonuclease family)
MAAPSQTGMVEGSARVLDGDTIEIGGVRVRFEGIDAPEFGQPCARRGGGTWSCGAAAANFLEKTIGNKPVSCLPRGTDKYGRMLGICHAGTVELNAELVRQGLAWAFVKYSERYVTTETEARSAALGVWQADTAPAWSYRAEKWAGAQRDAPEGCAIKGNVSRKGHIYHMPWSPWYGRVKVDVARGERWFCSEADAVAAGWRAAYAP